MIRLTSIEQALSLRGHIPELAILRSQQFQSEGYSPEEHGHIIVLETEDDIRQITEIGPDGLYDSDGLPCFEFVEAFVEHDRLIYEVVIVIDNSKTVALIIRDEPGLDPSLCTILRHAAGKPQPLPQLERTTP